MKRSPISIAVEHTARLFLACLCLVAGLGLALAGVAFSNRAAVYAEEEDPLPVCNDEEAQVWMYYAVQNGESETLKRWIVAHPASINLKNGELLQGACGFADNPAVVKMLLDAGADPNVKQENSENNCLHIVLDAAREDTPILENVQAICTLLVAKGCDVNYQRPSDGFSPIIMAAKIPYIGQGIMAALLAAENADVSLRSTGEGANLNRGWSVLHYVCDREPAETGENKEVCELLIAKGADVMALTPAAIDVTRENWTPLHIASARNTDRDDVAALLVAKGAVVDAVDSQQWTPLHVAMWNNNPRICQLLLDKGADIHSKNSDGTDILVHSYAYGRDKHLESAEVIIKWAENQGR